MEKRIGRLNRGTGGPDVIKKKIGGSGIDFDFRIKVVGGSGLDEAGLTIGADLNGVLSAN